MARAGRPSAAGLARRAPHDEEPSAAPPVRARRVTNKNRVLLELSRRDLLRHGLEDALKVIVDASAAALGVERVGIWLYDEDRLHIRCRVLHQELRPAGFDQLSADSYPTYFAALATHLVVDARNARSDPRTAVLGPEYLEPLGIRAMLDAPIFVSGRMIGIVCHESLTARRAWTEDEQRFASQLADLAGLVLEEHERRRADAMTGALLELARDVSGTLELDDILARSMRNVAGLLGCEAVGIFRIQEPQREGRLVAHHGLTAELAAAAAQLVFTEDQPLAAVARRGETIVLDAATARAMLPPEIATRFRVCCLLVAPLRTGERHFGSLVALHQAERSFDSRQVEFCGAVARHVAGAMDVADMYHRERQDAELSASLVRIGRELNSDLSLDALLRRLCECAVELVGGEESAVWLTEGDAPALARAARFARGAGSGASSSPVRVELLRLAPAIEALDRDGVLRIAAGAPSAELVRPLLDAPESAGGLVVALRDGTGLIGLHVLLRRDGGGFDAAQERLLRGMAEIASTALGHARLLAQLARANAVRADFVNAVSHELRTPLHVIMGYTEMLLEGACGPLGGEQGAMLRRISAQSRGLYDLISSTLDLGRLEAGSVGVDLRDVALQELLRDVERDARALIEGKKPELSFTLELSAVPAVVHTDAGKLRIILRNLIDNAVKFTDAGWIRLACEAAAEDVALEVADSGIGIAPEFQGVIFEGFQQGDPSATARFGGVGLGLYVVRRLVDLLGGNVAVASNPGTGSRFTVRLPLAAGRSA